MVSPARAADPSPPMLRVGPYLLDEVVGRGTSGVVWRAYDEVTGDVVAVKLLDGPLAREPVSQARFSRECELVGAFSHPGLVRLRARGRTLDGNAYLVMDLALGRTLQTRLRQEPPPSRSEAFAIIRRAAEGLAAMHVGGWVHRDVKPANLILDGEDRPRLLDFGLTAQAEGGDDPRLTRAGFFVGTPLYLAPEQLLGARPTPAMDVYALGVILYEMLVGSPPFMGATEHILTTKATRDAPAYQGLAPVADLLLQLLHRDPAHRPADASALIDELNRVEQAIERGAFRPKDGPALGASPEAGPSSSISGISVPAPRPLVDAPTLVGEKSLGAASPPEAWVPGMESEPTADIPPELLAPPELDAEGFDTQILQQRMVRILDRHAPESPDLPEGGGAGWGPAIWVAVLGFGVGTGGSWVLARLADWL